MNNKNFVYSDVLGYGAKVMAANFPFFAGIFITMLLLIYTPMIVGAFVKPFLPDSASLMVSIVVQITTWFIQVVVGIGLIKICLSFCSETKPAFSTLFAAQGCFWRYIGVTILYILIMYAGFLLFIVPGIIWAVKFSLARYFVVDKGLGPIQALKASSRATMGVKLDLFAFGLLLGLINMAGVLCLLFGLLATFPIVVVASALVYRQLAAQTPDIEPLLPATETSPSIEVADLNYPQSFEN